MLLHSFHQFKRLSTTTSSTRSSIYFVDSTLLDTEKIVEKIARKVKRSLSYRRGDDGISGGCKTSTFSHRNVEELRLRRLLQVLLNQRSRCMIFS